MSDTKFNLSQLKHIVEQCEQTFHGGEPLHLTRDFMEHLAQKEPTFQGGVWPWSSNTQDKVNKSNSRLKHKNLETAQKSYSSPLKTIQEIAEEEAVQKALKAEARKADDQKAREVVEQRMREEAAQEAPMRADDTSSEEDDDDDDEEEPEDDDDDEEDDDDVLLSSSDDDDDQPIHELIADHNKVQNDMITQLTNKLNDIETKYASFDNECVRLQEQMDILERQYDTVYHQLKRLQGIRQHPHRHQKPPPSGLPPMRK